jgi:hypothetical protein
LLNTVAVITARVSAMTVTSVLAGRDELIRTAMATLRRYLGQHWARLRSLNQAPATLTHSLPSEAWGGCGDVGQGRVQPGQFEAPLGSGVEVYAGGGFVEETFDFALVIWAVHSVLFCRRPGRPWPGH